MFSKIILYKEITNPNNFGINIKVKVYPFNRHFSFINTFPITEVIEVQRHPPPYKNGSKVKGQYLENKRQFKVFNIRFFLGT